ncbi:MAG: EF-hand domain-containing protein [Polaromonas sp.]|uniref:EF-hand domain-containing protein n=1 Tax=Polaromonas sp. TaxID=1869339 RepID=UPI00273002D0|nr:EF-hand domain-containing protein [Polaromonas sp.]MDP1742826.1 EF-hand domain-containing protein [Polaromonas sp.]MDP1955951.1 EF-hand domain-containing protein [Polaromonas sp.]MDP3752840.1 EF-hand domain-containing protein [Polaromonas sp.]
MTAKIHFIPNFELRSVALLAALTVGAALSGQAQTTDSGAAKAPAAQGAPATRIAAPKAAPHRQDTDAAFARADTNKDGKLSRQEATRLPAVEQGFDQIDTNKDQFVSREEFEAAIKS